MRCFARPTCKPSTRRLRSVRRLLRSSSRASRLTVARPRSLREELCGRDRPSPRTRHLPTRRLCRPLARYRLRTYLHIYRSSGVRQYLDHLPSVRYVAPKFAEQFHFGAGGRRPVVARQESCRLIFSHACACRCAQGVERRGVGQGQAVQPDSTALALFASVALSCR